MEEEDIYDERKKKDADIPPGRIHCGNGIISSGKAHYESDRNNT